jgi:hypothetical protein
MRYAGNFNPEWGYLAPAPTFMRTARVFIVAAAIGGTAGAVVVLSLMDRPAAETSVAARTLVSAVEPSPLRPLEAPSLVGGAQAAVPLQEHAAAADAVSPTQHPETATAISPQSALPLAHAALTSAGEHGGAVASRHATIAAPLVEAPRIMAPEVPVARAAVAESSAAPEVAASPAPAPAARMPVRKRYAGRATPRYAAPRYDYRPYAFLRQYGQY